MNIGKLFTLPSKFELPFAFAFDRVDLAAENIIEQLYRQYNSLRTCFNTAPSQVCSELFTRNCTSFYGISMCDLG